MRAFHPTIATVAAAATAALAATTIAATGGASTAGATPDHPSTARGGTTAVRPIPASAGHVFAQTLASPPDTAYCKANIGISCYSPLQYQQAYDVKPLYARGITGKGRTIAIIDSFGSPTIAHDLHVFDQNYGLQDPPTLKIITPAGAPPPFDPTDPTQTGWAGETTLDVEYAHAMAPDANILLVETPVAETLGVTGFPEMMAAENYVINHHLADVVTQSFGATENTFPSKQSLLDLRSAFVNADRNNVTVLASSGDDGATDPSDLNGGLYSMPVNSWPSSDPLVTSIGGTQLHLDAAGNRIAPDQAWNDGYGATGGGLSQVFSRPRFQNTVRKVVGDQRGTPDISMSAAVDGAAIMYYSYDPRRIGWHLVGGTSEASPIFSGVVALADQLAGRKLGNLNDALYHIDRQAHSGIVDVTIGDNSFAGVTGYQALPGYDLATGLGTVDVSKFVPVLARRGGRG